MPAPRSQPFLPESDRIVVPPRIRRALAVFEDRRDCRLLRFLTPGYRHCFCALGEGLLWTICDPLKSRLELTSVDGMDGIELGKHFRSQGMTVLLGIVGSASATRCRWLRPVTCVEIVKRALHVDAPHVLTPAQLHAELIRPSRGRERFRPLEELLRTA